MSCFYEKDPRDTGYIALYVAVIWYKFLDADQSWRIIEGRCSAKPGKPLTPEILKAIIKIMQNPNYKNFRGVEQQFKVDERDVLEALQNPSVWRIKAHTQSGTGL
jgi:hypothetical protein